MYNIAQEQPYKDLAHNYSYKNKVYLLDELTIENTSRLMADITEMIDYERKHSHIIEWFINSPGGSVLVCKSLLALMKMANIHNIINITYVIGEAASSASLIAINGDSRYILPYANHYIHYGSSGMNSSHPVEARRNYEDDKIFYNWVKSMYLDHTSIPGDKIEALMEHEGGYLYAKDCLKYKLVDYIL